MFDAVFESAPLLYAGVFILGTLIGSFLNVVILRLPALLEYDWRCQCRELLELDPESDTPPPGIVLSRSRCPHCGHGIRAWENVPLFSYVALGGKCSNCRSGNSHRAPIR